LAGELSYIHFGSARMGAPSRPASGGTDFYYPSDAFTTGCIAGRIVDCLTAQQQLVFRKGYKWRDRDYHDGALLRRWISHPFELRPNLGRDLRSTGLHCLHRERCCARLPRGPRWDPADLAVKGGAGSSPVSRVQWGASRPHLARPMSLAARGSLIAMSSYNLVLALPTADRSRAYAFAQALGLETPGELAEDGVPEPLRVQLNEQACVMSDRWVRLDHCWPRHHGARDLGVPAQPAGGHHHRGWRRASAHRATRISPTTALRHE
jgi:hypothetical protein